MVTRMTFIVPPNFSSGGRPRMMPGNALCVEPRRNQECVLARLLEGEKMASLCAEFGISRKTGYKIFAREAAAAVHRAPSRVGWRQGSQCVSVSRHSQLSFSKASELVGDGAHTLQR